MVAGDATRDPPMPVGNFEAQIIVLDHPNRIMAGYTPVIDCHTAHVACRFTKLLRLVNKRNGDTIEENPKVSAHGLAIRSRSRLCPSACPAPTPALARFPVPHR